MTSQLQGQLKTIRTQLAEKEKYILRCIKTIEEAQLSFIAKARKEMEQKRDQAEQNLQALQKIKEQPDIFLFFKVSCGILLFFMDLPISQPGDLSENHTNDIFPFSFLFSVLFFFFLNLPGRN